MDLKVKERLREALPVLTLSDGSRYQIPDQERVYFEFDQVTPPHLKVMPFAEWFFADRTSYNHMLSQWPEHTPPLTGYLLYVPNTGKVRIRYENGRRVNPTNA